MNVRPANVKVIFRIFILSISDKIAVLEGNAFSSQSQYLNVFDHDWLPYKIVKLGPWVG